MNKVEIENLEVEGKEITRVIPNIGLKENDRHTVANSLKKVLADTFCLVTMSLNYHWNVRGPLFKQIHELTEDHYNNLFKATDEIAERIRALGFNAPGTLKEFNDLTSVSLPNGELSDMEMIVDLVESHEITVNRIKSTIKKASDYEDLVTEDMLIARLDFHEKSAWMLRSHLEK